MLETETPMQVLSRFRVGLREAFRSELFARNVDTLEKAYALVQDLDEVKSNKTHDYKASVPRPPLQSSKAELHPVLPNLRLTTRVRVLKEAFPNLILRPNVINVRVMDI